MQRTVASYSSVKHSKIHPKFLNSNSTSHRWPFGAMAELLDNAMDPDVKAQQFCIDMQNFDGIDCLVFMDNGGGMTPDTLHKMLGFGHSDKKDIDGHRPIGKYGSGFKSGSMRLGQDALVLTKHTTSQSVGFLSQTFLKAAHAEEILVPMITWSLDGQQLNADAGDVQQSLNAIRDYSVFQDEAGLLMQLDAIQGSGTIIIISNLRRNSADQLELDFDADASDIRIAADPPEEGSASPAPNYQQSRATQPKEVDVPLDYSLRQYVSVLYKVPRMQVFIREKKVKVKRMTSLLRDKLQETYRPQSNPDFRCDIEMGFNTENENLYGMMLYHRNRLIRPYHRVGLQLEPNDKGLGVLGVVEADFLQPTHNKQDFDDTPAYRNMVNKLGQVLKLYWWEKMDRLGKTPRPLSPNSARGGRTRITQAPAQPEDGKIPDDLWVQCDFPQCLKWRKMPPGTHPDSLPDNWFCYNHPDPAKAALSHTAPEEAYKIPAEAEAAKHERRRQFQAAERERKSRNKTAAELAQEQRELQVRQQQEEQQAEATRIAGERRRLQQEQAAATARLQAEQKKQIKEEQLRMKRVQQEQQQAFQRQQEVLLRAQKAEEERARSEAALHALQQHNLHLQQQQEAQRLAGLERDHQQRLQEEQEQQKAQTRMMAQEAQQSSAPQHSAATAHQSQGPEAAHTQQQHMQPQLQGSGSVHSHRGTSRAGPSKHGTGKRDSSSQDSAGRSESGKRQALNGSNAGVVSASQARQAKSSPQLDAGLPVHTNANGSQTAAHMDSSHVSSEGTRSNDRVAPAGTSRHKQAAEVQGEDRGGTAMPEQDLVAKLAANLQMALKAVSILKRADPTVFENLQPADLANLDLRALCETPGSTPE